MSPGQLAILISVASVFVAALALGWNIYRDVVLKPRVRVRFHIASILGEQGRLGTYLSLSATNHGPGRVRLSMKEVEAA